ncbi:MAG: 30S ribosomal protein S20 [Phycisphaerales bacterium]|jgi:small subunit ribosomal protein S20|nr:30S ribosomal protein S20 [Phycisphaerales bacterium]
MAHSLSAKKRIRQNEKRNARNRWRKATMRDAIKDLTDKILHAPLVEAEAALKTAAQIIDRTAQKGTIHKNQAARRKSRLTARIVARKKAGITGIPPKK